MIYYLYPGTYDIATSKTPGTSDHKFHLQAHIIDDKYAVRGLSKLVKDRLCEFLNASWRTEAFAEMIEAVYATDLPDHGVRKKALRVALFKRYELFAIGGSFQKFTEVARSTPEFMHDVLWMGAASMGMPKTTPRYETSNGPGVRAWETSRQRTLEKLEEGVFGRA